MNEHKNVVEVIIGGEVHKLISTESPEHMQKVANYINKKIIEIYKNTTVPTINSHLKYLSITINLADDFIKQQCTYDKLLQESEVSFSEKNLIESENHILKQKIKMLQSELDELTLKFENSKLELEEYIDTFGKDKLN